MTTYGDPLSALNRLFDRAIGAEGLRPAVRERLLRRQLGSIDRTAPAMLAAAIMIFAVLGLASWHEAAFAPALGVTLLIVLLHAASLLAVRQPFDPARDAEWAAAVAVSLSFAGGCLWGVVVWLLPAAGTAFAGPVLLGCGGVLVIASLSLVHYPQALAVYCLPLILGAAARLPWTGLGLEAAISGLLLLGLAVVIVVLGLQQAASLLASGMVLGQAVEGASVNGVRDGKADWTWGMDEEGLINRLSAGFAAATGVGESDLLGGDFIYFLRCVTEPDNPLMERLERDIAAREAFEGVELQVVAGGQECWWSLSGRALHDRNGVYLGYAGIGSDISQRRLADRRITTLAHHDSLTGLLNRARFNELLDHSVTRLARYGTPFAVLMIDLDGFKAVNDSQGHRSADLVLTELARRMKSSIREGDMVARLGGDEFAVLMPSAHGQEAVRSVAARLIAHLQMPVTISGKDVAVSASIGVAMAPAAGRDADQILHHAGLALQRVKAEGRGAFRMAESTRDRGERQRPSLDAQLRQALIRQELVLHYQPLVSASTGDAMGFEALIRWNHPERGLVLPSEFIGFAEESDLIVDIGNWTIEEACMTAALWPEHLTVSVNLSAKHFLSADIGLVIRQALGQSGLAPHRLEIEITEGLLLEAVDSVVEKLREIRALGVTIAMDDFGTGYSSLSYLLKFPFDKIKIDQSFVAASTRDEVARDILRAIASLGRSLRVTITAEGVETAEQAAFLSEIACHQLQGYHFAKPLDPAELPNYLLSHVAGRLAASEARQRA